MVAMVAREAELGEAPLNEHQLLWSGRGLQGLLPLRKGGSGISVLRKGEFKAHAHDAMIPITTKQGFPGRGQGKKAFCVRNLSVPGQRS